MKNKYLWLVMGGIVFVSAPVNVSAATMAPFVREITPVVTLIASPTPTATPTFKLIKPIKTLVPLGAAYQYKNKRSELRNVKVTEKTDTYITVDNEGVGVKVTFQSNTHYRRRYWGKSSIAEISVGNSVDVVGRWANEEKTEIKAVLIRNLSIQRRYGVFFGTIKSFTDTGFVMTTINRGEETVAIESAKLINREGTSISKDDLQVGHKVRVKGLWDSTNFTITEVVQIKDFSIPVVSSPTPTPTP